MKLPEGYGPKVPCADGEHVFHSHNHGHVPAEYQPRCSGRFVCAECRNWFDGEACKPAAA